MPSKNPTDSLLSCNMLGKGSISNIYNLMTYLASSSLDNIKRAWEEDLDRPLSEDIWNCVLKQLHSSSMCARHSLIQFKVVHRAHISKVKLAQMFSSSSLMCNRCQWAEGIHVLDMPKIRAIMAINISHPICGSSEQIRARSSGGIIWSRSRTVTAVIFNM